MGGILDKRTTIIIIALGMSITLCLLILGMYDSYTKHLTGEYLTKYNACAAEYTRIISIPCIRYCDTLMDSVNFSNNNHYTFGLSILP